jgi:hypothetical protein
MRREQAQMPTIPGDPGFYERVEQGLKRVVLEAIDGKLAENGDSPAVSPFAVTRVHAQLSTELSRQRHILDVQERSQVGLLLANRRGNL